MSSTGEQAIDTPDPMAIAQQCAALHSRVFSRLVTRHYNAFLRPTGLMVTQFTIMNAITLFTPDSIHHLAETLGMERTSLQRTVDKMIDKGLLQTRSSGHNRSLELSLTQEGKRVYKEASVKWNEAHQAFVDMAGTEEWSSVVEKLQGFSASLKSNL
ncbi:MarR family winged helix-turn-helix transcriptional regulator [Marinobacter sp. HN1S83]|uniref:MarR family winged helix-turn-helix transcriptional regulator n=1 Tax=Marinobacter sp. HN1S83 TaxID=3382301 RepID=UPI00387AB06A